MQYKFEIILTLKANTIVLLLFNSTSALFMQLVSRTVEIQRTTHCAEHIFYVNGMVHCGKI